MKISVEPFLQKIAGKLGFMLFRKDNPAVKFQSNHYMRHNARRLEHLASLGIPVSGMSVLDVGAGIGDHSHYYMDRGCRITITEVRSENLQFLRTRFPNHDIQPLDMDSPTPLDNAPFDLVHCYGLLYHLNHPLAALEFMDMNCSRMLFLETCVSFGDEEGINTVKENKKNPTQAYSGTGCRPTRFWVMEQLKRLFEYVYIPQTQPNHEEFPLDWLHPEKHGAPHSRAIFIASREKIDNDLLSPSLMDYQARHP